MITNNSPGARSLSEAKPAASCRSRIRASSPSQSCAEARMSSRFLVRKIPRSKVTVSSKIGLDAELANIVAECKCSGWKFQVFRSARILRADRRHLGLRSRKRGEQGCSRTARRIRALQFCLLKLAFVMLRFYRSNCDRASLSNIASMSSESKTTVLYQNLDTSFVNLWGLLRKLTHDGFIGRVRVELKDYTADVFMTGSSTPLVHEIDRATGTDTLEEAALHRLVLRARESPGMISVFEGPDEAVAVQSIAAPKTETAGLDSGSKDDARVHHAPDAPTETDHVT